MMIIDFIKNNLDKIWTLLATIIGAFISYMATTASEKRKERRESQREKLKDILIPLCSSIENALEVMDNYKTTSIEVIETKIKEPTKFLKAEKRVYLTESQRKQLQQYDASLKCFLATWDKEQEMVFTQYRMWIADKMQEHRVAASSMYVTLGLSWNSNDIRPYILKKEIPAIKQYITGLSYVINDEPENYRSLDISFDENIKNLCGEMKYGISTIEDVDDPETQLACEIYDYLWEIDDKGKLQELFDKTKTNDNLFGLAAKGKGLLDVLLKDIDKITS